MVRLACIGLMEQLHMGLQNGTMRKVGKNRCLNMLKVLEKR